MLMLTRNIAEVNDQNGDFVAEAVFLLKIICTYQQRLIHQSGDSE